MVTGQLLEPKYKDHQLSGNWKGGKRIKANNIYIRKDNTYIKECKIIWEKKFNEIPDGYDIHHEDENPLNNTPITVTEKSLEISKRK